MYLPPFILLAVLLLLLLFLPDLLPRCSCCLRLKPRPLIRIHRAVGLNPGYKGYRSVCKKCCRKYDISELSDLDRLKRIRRRIMLEMLKRDAGL